MRPLESPLMSALPGEVDVVAQVVHAKAHGEGVVAGIYLHAVNHLARDRVPIPVAHGHVEATHELDPAQPYVP